ncbi:MAG: class IV adenylate cyclase [Chloroflexota bacterium]
MAKSPQEIEVKFYVQDLKKLEARLREWKAHLIQPRVHEANIRFDTPNRDLGREKRVLRLRQDEQVHLTYKGPGRSDSGVLSRTEIEFTADDFEKAEQFLEALGFEKSFFYEKYRTVYELGELHFMLDETPIGNFMEIEGPGPDQIRALSERLELDWSAAVGVSYAALFERVRVAQELPFDDLSFTNFHGHQVSEIDLGVKAADR